MIKEIQKCSRGHHLYSPNNGLISTGREIFKEQCCKNENLIPTSYTHKNCFLKLHSQDLARNPGNYGNFLYQLHWFVAQGLYIDQVVVYRLQHRTNN